MGLLRYSNKTTLFIPFSLELSTMGWYCIIISFHFSTKKRYHVILYHVILLLHNICQCITKGLTLERAATHLFMSILQ